MCGTRLSTSISVCALVLVTGCVEERVPDSRSTQPAASAPASWLTEITDEAGLRFDDTQRPAGTFFLPEVMGAGVALLDYDGDERLDILQLRFPPPGSAAADAPNRLLRQKADGTFEEVGAAAGLADPGYGQAAAIGDIDSDGDPDLYVANFGADALYTNDGSGSFSRLAAPGDTADKWWSSAATFCDYDRDGDLDLYVVHYLRYEFRGTCRHGSGYADYCAPSFFDGVYDSLLRNDGNLQFTDVSAAAGIERGAQARAKGLGVVCADFTGDAWPDFYVANDNEMNQLWVNRHDGSFVDEAILRGVAVNRHGFPEASMGIAHGDTDRDGNPELFLTHVARETNTLYRGLPGATFADHTAEAGLAIDDLPLTGFGCAFFDLENDGDLDLALVNGRVYRGPVIPPAPEQEFWSLYAEPNSLYLNDGDGHFVAAGQLGSAFTDRVEVSRGLASGDIDADGDVDLVVSNNDDTLQLFRNDAPRGATHWLAVRALDGVRDGIGARIAVVAGGRRFESLVLPAASYQSSHDSRVHFGLGPIERIDGVEVLWSDGDTEWFSISEVDRRWTVQKGNGVAR